MRGRKYAYAQIKVTAHYGEKDELQRFLDEANGNGWDIVEVLDVGQGYWTFIYTLPEEKPRRTRVKNIEK